MNPEIKPVDIDESKFNRLEHQVGAVKFSFPACLCGVGAVKSGKSTLLYNLITDKFNKVFEDRVILFSPSESDPIIRKLIDDDLIFAHFCNYSNETFRKVLDIIEANHEEHPQERWLIVFDDMLASMFKHNMSEEGRWLNSYISKYRHYPCEGVISLMFFSQYWKDYSVILRCNSSHVLFIGQHSQKNKKTYAEELSGCFGGDEYKFNDIWNQAKKGKFDFLTLDFNELKAYRNFEEVLYDRDVENDIKPDEDGLKGSPDVEQNSDSE